MDKVEFLTIFPIFEKLDVVRVTLPTVITETRRANARLIVHDCSVKQSREMREYLDKINRDRDFFLVCSDNMSLAHSRNLCLALGQELYAPDYICVLEDDHGYRDGVIDSLVAAMRTYYGKTAPNGLKFGMFTACAVHTHAKLKSLADGNQYPVEESDTFSLGGANNCFRCAPTSHWNNVLRHYETDEYLLSEYQTAAPRWRNYHKGFTVLFVDGGAGTFEVENTGRGMTGSTTMRLWDKQYCASDRRSHYIGKVGEAMSDVSGYESKSVSMASQSGRGKERLRKRMKNVVRRIQVHLLKKDDAQLSDQKHASYSQCGEDRILQHIFTVFGIEKPRYLDIGAHHPIALSNTYLFYQKGASGVLVEPNPARYRELEKARPRDVCLNVGVGETRVEDVPFYVLRSDTLSTFWWEEANRIVRDFGGEILQVVNVNVLTPADIFTAHFKGGPNLLSIDVEGLEMDILRAIDFNVNRPEAICIETLSYSNDGTGVKNSEVIEYLKEKDYMVFADTRINTIFVDSKRWRALAHVS